MITHIPLQKIISSVIAKAPPSSLLTLEKMLHHSYHRLDATNIYEFPLKWQRNRGLDPDLNSTHSEYLAELCDKFFSIMEAKISDAANLLQMQTLHPVYQEVLHHGAYCREKAKDFLVSSIIKDNI